MQIIQRNFYKHVFGVANAGRIKMLTAFASLTGCARQAIADDDTLLK
jgi:hypothetical protein